MNGDGEDDAVVVIRFSRKVFIFSCGRQKTVDVLKSVVG